MCHKYHVKHISETIQPKLFEAWIGKGHRRDANLCGAYARPTDERSLVRAGEGYNQGSFVYFAKAWVDVESPPLALLTKRWARDLGLYYQWNERLSGNFSESALPHANRRFCRHAPIMIEGGSLNQMVFNWERGHGGCWFEGSRGEYLSVGDFFLLTRTRGRVYTELGWHKRFWGCKLHAWVCSVLRRASSSTLDELPRRELHEPW